MAPASLDFSDTDAELERAFEAHCGSLQSKLGDAITSALEIAAADGSDLMPMVAIQILKSLPINECIEHTAGFMKYIAEDCIQKSTDTRTLQDFVDATQYVVDAANTILDPSKAEGSSSLKPKLAAAATDARKKSDPQTRRGSWKNLVNMQHTAYVHSEWTKNCDAPPPKELRLCAAEGAISQIAPLFLETRHMRDQVKELTEQERAIRPETLLTNRTFVSFKLKQTQKKLAKVEANLEASIDALDQVIASSASAIAKPLLRDSEDYSREMIRMDSEEPGVMQTLQHACEELVNTHSLQHGDEVEFIDHTTELMVRGKVVRLPGERPEKPEAVQNGGTEGTEAAVTASSPQPPLPDGVHQLRQWNVYIRADEPYQEGFDTKHTLWVLRPRHKIYHASKQLQVLSTAAVEAARQHASASSSSSTPTAAARVPFAPPMPNTAEFLMLLYADAERTLPHLTALSQDVEGAVPSLVKSMMGPLKAVRRAVVKTLEKYKGQYSKLTDLARMTFVCDTLSDALRVLHALHDAKGWELLLIKNRLSLAFSAEETGGYRDLLTNLRCDATGHICEVQVTLQPLIKIKEQSGHRSYALARALRLNDRSTFCHTGGLNERILGNIRSGILREVECVAASELELHFDDLIYKAIRSPYCSISSLSISSCTWPKGRRLDELLEALCSLGSQLKEVVVAAMCTGGSIPPAFLKACNQIRVLDFGHMDLSGHLPPEIGELKELTALLLGKNKLSGAVPTQISSCSKLKTLSLHTNQLSDATPTAIAKCKSLTYVRLDANNFGDGRTAEIEKQLLGLLPTTTKLYVGSGPPPSAPPIFRADSKMKALA